MLLSPKKTLALLFTENPREWLVDCCATSKVGLRYYGEENKTYYGEEKPLIESTSTKRKKITFSAMAAAWLG